MPSPQLSEVMERYSALPYANIPSNEPYGVTESPDEDARRKVEKERFMADASIVAPHIEYPQLRYRDIADSERQLQELLQQVEIAEAPEAEKK